MYSDSLAWEDRSGFSDEQQNDYDTSMTSPRLEAYVKGSDDRGGELYFDDLTRLCENLSACLRATEAAITQKRPQARYHLDRIESGSISLIIGVEQECEESSIANEAIRLFNNTVDALQKGSAVDSRLGRKALEAYRQLAERFLKHRAQLRLSGVKITSRFVSTVDELLQRFFVSHGSVKGRIERLNIHNRNECSLYVPISDIGIDCTFDKELFSQVHAAVGQNATIYGTLEFSGQNALPETVKIDSIEIHRADKELPTLMELRGLLRKSPINGSVKKKR